jgi:hypothetical protein
MAERKTMNDGVNGPEVLEYANFVVSVIQEDIHHVHVRVTAALGLAAVFVTQLPLETLQALPERFRIATVAGIVLLVIAALCLFHYSQKLNQARIAIARHVLDQPIQDVASDWASNFGNRWTRYIVLYGVGQWTFALGALTLGTVVAKLLLDP